MKQKLPISRRYSWLGILLILFSLSSAAQFSTNTKYRIRHNASTNLYLGNDGNGNNAATLVADDNTDSTQVWTLLESETTGEYWLRNMDGTYLGRLGSPWWETEMVDFVIGDSSFVRFAVNNAVTSGTYYIDPLSIGDGEGIGTDGTDIGNFVFNNKSGTNAEWVFETVSNDFITYSSGAWSNGTGPTSTDDVLIDGTETISGSITANSVLITEGSTLTLSSGASLDIKTGLDVIGKLVVESSASLLTYESADYNWRDVTIKRNRSVSTGRYSLVGSPVAGAIVSDLGSQFIESFDEATNNWADASGDLVAGKGYAAADNTSISFTGTPNTGDVVVAVTATSQGYNLVANPYGAAISAADFINGQTVINNAIYLWNDGGSETGSGSSANYLTANASGLDTEAVGGTSSSMYNGSIGSMQGFFIDATGAGDVTFTEAMRETGNNADGNFYRIAKIPYVKLSLLDVNGMERVTTIGWAVDANDVAINQYYDSRIFDGSADFAVYTMKASEKLAIQGITENATELALGVNLAESGTYTISQFNGEFEDRGLYLIDHVSGSVTNLSVESYTFSAGAGELADRFTLATSPSDVLSVGPELVEAYVTNNVLYYNGTIDSEFKVINLSGQLVRDLKVRSKSTFDLSGLMRAGVYILTDGNRSTKFILN